MMVMEKLKRERSESLLEATVESQENRYILREDSERLAAGYR